MTSQEPSTPDPPPSNRPSTWREWLDSDSDLGLYVYLLVGLAAVCLPGPVFRFAGIYWAAVAAVVVATVWFKTTPTTYINSPCLLSFPSIMIFIRAILYSVAAIIFLLLSLFS